MVYRPTDVKVDELQSMVDKIHLERRNASIETLSPAKESKEGSVASDNNNNFDGDEGESALASISSLLMPSNLYNSYKSSLDVQIIDNIYNIVAQDRDKERQAKMKIEKEKELAIQKKIIDEIPEYSTPNEWEEDAEDEEEEEVPERRRISGAIY